MATKAPVVPPAYRPFAAVSQCRPGRPQPHVPPPALTLLQPKLTAPRPAVPPVYRPQTAARPLQARPAPGVTRPHVPRPALPRPVAPPRCAAPARAVIQRAAMSSADVTNALTQGFYTVMDATMVYLDGTTGDEARESLGRFQNGAGLHAEEHFIAAMTRMHGSMNGFWHGDAIIRIDIRINNSPCGTDEHNCAGQLIDWAAENEVTLNIETQSIYHARTDETRTAVAALLAEGHAMEAWNVGLDAASSGIDIDAVARGGAGAEMKVIKKQTQTQDFLDGT